MTPKVTTPVPEEREGPPARRLRPVHLLVAGVILVVLGGIGVALWEMRTSTLQSRWLSRIAAELSWEVAPGPSPEIVFPPEGPYDVRLGYSRIPAMVDAAGSRGFAVVEQTRVSARFREVVTEWGLSPIYSEKTRAGLAIRDREGSVLSEVVLPARVFQSFEEIPPIVWSTLLFIENRSLLSESQPRKNPAVEWPRLFLSATELGLRFVGREGNVPGASTLATQIEKFRHSPEGLTSSPRDKLLQMASASLRAYQRGPITIEARRRIVLDYLNSVPLAAQRGEGEIIGMGDGLWAWYGRDLDEVVQLLRDVDAPDSDPDPGVAVAWAEAPPGPGSWREKGAAYREVLGLLLSQRRPTYYLARPEGREALAVLTDRYLTLLENEGLLPPALAEAARETHSEPLTVLPPRPPVSFIERKAVNAVRTQLLTLLEVPALYDLDRLDLEAVTTIDGEAQDAVTDFIVSLADSEFVRSRGLEVSRLLARGDPAQVVYSVVLHERTPNGNVVRIQTDNLDAPFNLNESARLELGSTAKLRTLATYLEVLSETHSAYSRLGPDSLRALELSQNDPLGRWARAQILVEPGIPLEELLRRSLLRTYSANPGERFVTGGGVQTFSNFDNTYNGATITVTEAFRQSVNLVFVRMMRDIVNHYVYRVPGSTANVLDDPESPLRQEYLSRFADREGIQYLGQFFPKYRDKTRGEVLTTLFQDRRLSPQRFAWAYRTVVLDGTVEEFEALLRVHQADVDISEEAVRDLYERANPLNWDLADLGYLASIHPLELWVARHLIETPSATLPGVVTASTNARQDVYRWLFRTSRRSAQDRRIRFLLEVEAFTEILDGWRRLGYPFENIVPSLGTSIGSSGDRPAALGELVGIILNDGLRVPTHRLDQLRFAQGTPYETRMVRGASVGEPVMAPEVARVLREAMVDVVEQGTARRMAGVLRSADGRVLLVGGKTGTGDNRYRTFSPGGREVESRSVNRTSTFVFFIEDRFYGVVTAYVPGEAADEYDFTSALPTQILRELAPVIEDLYNESVGVPDEGVTADS